MKKIPKITAVILNTNRKEDTIECLHSLYQNDYPEISVIVLDNASTDGSNDAIRKNFPQVQIVTLSENLGYAGNNNVGIELALKQGSDYILVMNEDIILAPDALSKMMEAVCSHPRTGIVGPLVYHANEPTTIQTAGGSFTENWEAYHRSQNEEDFGQYSSVEPVKWISGCAICVNREAILEAGMIDSRFFYYWEETEWCYRVSKSGWKILIAPQAKIWHKGVQRDYQPGANVTYYSTRNRLLFFKKHRAPLRAWLKIFYDYFRTISSWTFKKKWHDKKDHRNAMVEGIVDFILNRWGIRSSTSAR